MKECPAYHLGLYLIVLSKLKFKNCGIFSKMNVTNVYNPFLINHSWINNHIKRLSSRKRNLYNKARSSQLESDWKAFKDLK